MASTRFALHPLLFRSRFSALAKWQQCRAGATARMVSSLKKPVSNNKDRDLAEESADQASFTTLGSTASLSSSAATKTTKHAHAAPSDTPGPVSFESLGVPRDFIKRLKDINIFTPTPVQAQAIPAILKGGHFLMQSETGSGKTLAYLLPMFGRSQSKPFECVIAVPTRELGVQVLDDVKALAPPGFKATFVMTSSDIDIAVEVRIQASIQHIIASRFLEKTN